MTAYRCLAVSAEGREVARTIEAPSERAAVSHLIAEGLTPVDVRTGTITLGELLNRPIIFSRGLSAAEQALLLSQLATLARAGVSIDRSLDLLRDQATRASTRDMLARTLAKVRSGEPLSRALDGRAGFPTYVIGVVRAAERSGRLAEALAALAARTATVADVRRRLVTALTYPAAVLAATVLALLLVLLIVVPQFEPIFIGEEARLPLLTRGVLALSNAVSTHSVPMLVAFGLSPVVVMTVVRSDRFAEAIAPFRHKMPGFALRDQYLASQLMGVLGTLVGNGVTAVEALPLVRDAVASRRWRRHVDSVERRVREGASLSAALRANSLVPPTAVRLVEVGERSGRLAEVSLEASRIMGEAAQARIERIVSLANPIAIILLGGLVAALVGGVMLGIFALGDFAG